MAMLDLGTLKIKVTVDNSTANKSFDETKKKSKETAKSIGTDWEKVGASLSKIGGSMTKFVTLPVIAAATACVKLASDTTETVNKVNEVFGSNADAISRWADGSIKKMGLSKQSAQDMAASFGDLGAGMKLSSTQNYEYSTSLTQLVADMASFKNMSTERVRIALQGIYTGETEALKALGIVMTEVNLEMFAANQGVEKQYKDMTQAEKVALRYSYVMDAAANASGDFARTSGETANQSRMVGENLKEMAASFGDVLAPTINSGIQSVNGLLETLSNLNPETKEFVVNTALVVAAIGPCVLLLGKGITAYKTLEKVITASNIKMQASAGVIGAVSIALGVLVAAAAASAAEYAEITKAATDLREATDSANDSILNAKTALTDNIASMSANAAMADRYCDRLDELAKLEQLDVAQKAEAAFLVDQLNSLYPSLNAQINEQTGLLRGGTEAIRTQTAAMREQATVAAYQEAYTATIKAQADILYAKAKAEAELQQIEISNIELRQQRIAIEEQFLALTGMTMQQFTAQQATERGALLNSNQAVKSLYAQYNNLGDALRDNQTATARLNKELGNNADAAAAAEKEVGIAEEAYQSLADTVDGVLPALDGAADSAEDLGAALQDAAADAELFGDDIINNFDKLPKAVNTSLQKATANLQANNATIAQWRDDLSALIAQGVDQGVVAKLEEMGPAYRRVISELVKASDEERNAFVAAMYATGTSTGEALADGVSSGVNGVGNAINDVQDSAKNLESTTKSSADQATKNINDVPQTVKNVSDKVVNELKQSNTGINEWSKEVLTLVASGIDASIIKMQELPLAHTTAIQTMIAQLEALMPAWVSSLNTYGSSGGSAFVAGVVSAINAALGTLYNTGHAAGQAVMRGYNDAQDIHSPSGEGKKSGAFYIDGIILGMRGKIGELLKTVSEIGSIRPESLRSGGLAISDIRSGGIVQQPVSKNTGSVTTNTVNKAAPKRVEQNNYYTVREMSRYEIYRQQRENSKALAEAL